MAVPDYATFMLPMLEVLADGKTRSARDVRAILAARFKLTEADLDTMLPSGKQRVFDNRVGWAKTYLSKAGLVAAPKRGEYQITDAGRKVLAKPPKAIDATYLQQFTGFSSFLDADDDVAEEKQPAGPKEKPAPLATATPEEQLASAYKAIRTRLQQELLDAIVKASPAFFEQLVVELLVKMGYGGSLEDAGRALGKSGDGGIDGIINEDFLGLDAIYVQAKRWTNTVGRPEVQAFAGSLEGVRARKGVFLTTSTFTKQADEFVRHIEKKIILIDGARLTNLMIDFGVGVTTIDRYETKRIDGDYFADDE